MKNKYKHIDMLVSKLGTAAAEKMISSSMTRETMQYFELRYKAGLPQNIVLQYMETGDEASIPIIYKAVFNSFLKEKNNPKKDTSLKKIISKARHKEPTLPRVSTDKNKRPRISASDIKKLAEKLSTYNNFEDALGKMKEEMKESESRDNVQIIKPEQKPKTGLLPARSDSFKLDWDNVEFAYGKLIVHPYTPNPLPKGFRMFNERIVQNPVCRKGFNYIKSYIAKKLPPIKCIVNLNNYLIFEDEIALRHAIIQISNEAFNDDIEVEEISALYRGFAHLSFEGAMNRASQLSPAEFRVFKSKFINYLVSKQDDNTKIAPCSEYIKNTNTEDYEDGFFFTVKNRLHSFIIFENLNPDRATLIFKVNTELYNDSLKAIYNFLTSNRVNKRMALKEKLVHLENYGVIAYCYNYHTTFDEWKQRMLKITVQ